jgi:hypothetical protein
MTSVHGILDEYLLFVTSLHLFEYINFVIMAVELKEKLSVTLSMHG